MSRFRRALTHVSRGALCAGALAGGGLLAHGAPDLSRIGDLFSGGSAAHAATLPADQPDRGARWSRLDMGYVETPIVPPREAAEPSGAAFRGGRIITGASKNRLILFTFDDGPNIETTPLLLDRLDEEDIRAVFFLTTNRFEDQTPYARRHAALAREIAERGHIIGNHTVHHPQLVLLDDAAAAYEIDHAAERIEEVTGIEPWLFRPPGGARSPRIDALIADRGYTSVLWNIGAGDFQVETADEVFETFKRVFERVEHEEGHPGGIVLLHDIYPHTVEAFPRIVRYFEDRNCELLEKEEELFEIVSDPRDFFTPRRDASPSATAPAAELDPDALAFRQERVRQETRARCRSLAMR